MAVRTSICKFGQLMPDGSNCSDTKILTLSMKEERPWMSQAELIMKTEMLLCGENTMD
jgi:hypothetical protein